MSETARRLAQLPLFAGLDDVVMEELGRRSRRRSFAAGETIFSEGEPPKGLYVLESGWVRVVKSSAQGREQVLQFVGSGEMFNTVAVFSSGVNPATAIALEPSDVTVLAREAVLEMLLSDPNFSLRVLENMADRLIYLVGLVADLSLRSVTGRLAQLILDGAIEGVLQRPRWYTTRAAARLGTVLMSSNGREARWRRAHQWAGDPGPGRGGRRDGRRAKR
jgi:CRP/FNR family transcriptional regulator